APPQPERHSMFDLPGDILPTEKPFTPPSEPVSSLTFQSKANRLPDRLSEEAEKPKPSLLDYDRMLFQVHNRFVLSQVKSGLMVVDQRAAYERILYDKYRTSLDKRNAASQQLLFPKTITLNPVDFQLVLEIQHEIRALGFDFAEIGKDAFIVYGIPI